MNKKEISQIIKNTCRQFSQSEIVLILNLLEKNKPQFEYLIDQIKERNLFVSSKYVGLFSQQTKAMTMSCLQMKVFDKRDNKKKCLEIFSQDQLGSTFDLVINYAQQSRFLVTKSIILNVLDSYRLDEDMPFYFIEYEDFDYSTQDSNQKLVSYQQSTGGYNQLDEGLNNYLYQMYLNIKPAFSTQQISKDVPLFEVLMKASFVFQKFNNQLIAKLHTVDPYLFEQYEKVAFLEQKKVFAQIPFEKLIKFNLSQSFDQSSFLKYIQENQQTFFQNHQYILKQIINSSNQFKKFSLLKINEQEDCFLLQAFINDNQSEYFEVKKYQNNQLAVSQLQKYNLILEDLNMIGLQTNVNLEIFDHFDGTYIVSKINYEVLNTPLQEVQNLLQINQIQLMGGLFSNSIQQNPEQYSKEQYIKFTKCLNITKTLINSFQSLFQHSISPNEIYISNDMTLTVRGEYLFKLSFINNRIQQNHLPQKYFNIISQIITYFGEYFSAKLQIANYQFVPNKVIQILQNYLYSFIESDESNSKLFYNQLQTFLNQLHKMKELNESFFKNIFYLSHDNLENLACKIPIFDLQYQDISQKLVQMQNIGQLIINRQAYQNLTYTPSFLNYNNQFKAYSDAKFNLESISLFIDNILCQIKNINDQIKIKIKNLAIELIKLTYNIQDLDLNDFIDINQFFDLNVCYQCYQTIIEDSLLNADNMLKLLNYCYLPIKYQNLNNSTKQYMCLSDISNQQVSKLASQIVNLQRIDFPLEICHYVRSQMELNSDYFDLKNKQCLLQINIGNIEVKDVIYIYKQLKQNKNNINTIQIQKSKHVLSLKKLQRLVQLI
ncbi:hypothetical protein ABPG74_013043 [Tetrahymena malaccensis]